MAETMDDILHPGLNATPEGFPDAPAGWTPEDGKKALQTEGVSVDARHWDCLLYTSPSPRDATLSRMPSSA